MAAIFMYLLVFWDWIPTVLLHEYYCRTQAGFFVYKTPEQWKQENPGVAETLTRYGNTINELPVEQVGAPGRNYVTKYNARIARDSVIGKRNFLSISRESDQIFDLVTHKVLAEHIDYEAGYGNPIVTAEKGSWKIWLSKDSCPPDLMKDSHDALGSYSNSILEMHQSKGPGSIYSGDTR